MHLHSKNVNAFSEKNKAIKIYGLFIHITNIHLCKKVEQAKA